MEITVWVEIPVKLKITSYSPGRAAYISGPPEHCYPADPMEFETEEFLADGTPAPECVRSLIDWEHVEQEIEEKMSEREEA